MYVGDGKNLPTQSHIAVIAPALSELDFARLWGDIDELPIAFKMDVVHFDTLKDKELKQQILRDGVLIHPEETAT